MGAYLFFGLLHGGLIVVGLFKGGLFERGSEIFLVVGHIPVELFLLVNYLFDAIHRSNPIFFD